ncbi:MAG: glycine--tRNA ligase [Phycisphaerales bacterium]
MTTEATGTKSMTDIVALCKRRGFVYPASEIYGGINGFWDYGPLGVELKNNLRDAWWQEMVRCPPTGPDGELLDIVGLDSSIIQNPRTWEASGHVAGFNDPMVDCRESKSRYRADQMLVFPVADCWFAFVENDDASEAGARKKADKYLHKPGVQPGEERDPEPLTDLLDRDPAALARVVGPDTKKPGTLTEPRDFNLMFESHTGAVKDDANKVYLRPETAQGIFLNHKNVVDTMRVRIPFGIAQIGKAFRNEVTPRNFIYRSREFEQMEMEWFCHPDEARTWFEFWQQRRLGWWKSMGLTDENLQIRVHETDELSHYARAGEGTVDIEYRFPFTAPGFAELEGIAHRTDFDLTAHQEHSKVKLQYFDQQRNERYMPHVIEPAAGLTRGLLAVICEAYTPDPSRPSKVFLKFHPRLAPIQAAIFPLVAKDGMPEAAERLYQELRARYTCQFDVKQNIGKRYARMDEAGTPYCFTIDGQTLEDQTVTVRNRDDAQQQRIGIDTVKSFLADRIKA